MMLWAFVNARLAAWPESCPKMFWFPRSIAYGLAAMLALACGGESASSGPSAAPVVESAAPQSGHQRMLTLLDEIRERTDSENHWHGEGPAKEARARLAALPPDASPRSRWAMLREVGEQELRIGNEQAAIELLLAAYEQMPRIEPPLPLDERVTTIFRLGVAYLRFGETQNCVHSGAEACILPIRGAAVHRLQEGSREAIRYFREVLDNLPRSSPMNIKAVWLMNVAYMTVGGYPDEVEPAYRMPESVLESELPLPHFENVAPELGLDSFNLSGGTVFDDLDGDGDFDLFTTTFDSRQEPHYFANQGDGTFRDETTDAGLRGLYGGLNVVHADYDNDGDADLYVLRGAWLYYEGRHPNSLLRNDGGRFVDVTFEAGLGAEHYPTQTAAWADYDNDGHVDLYVGNEQGDGLGEFAETTARFEAPSQLFHNNGDGTFTDVAAAAGVDVRAFVKAVAWGDVDNDGDPDLYLSVMGGRNHLFRNNGDGTFTDVAAAAGVDGPVQSFPVWFWDYDNDGNLDLFVATYRGTVDGVAFVAASYFGAPVPYEKARLYRGDGRGGFEDVSESVGLTRLHLPMGCNFGDLDNDGWLDFYLGTGYPDYEAVMPNVLYLNRGGRSFADVTLAAGFGHLQKGHGVAFADYDEDGDQDVFIQMGGAFPGDRFGDALFRNPGFDNHWVGLRLVGRQSNRAALGAHIRVDLVDGGASRSVHRRVSTGSSFGGNPMRQTLGLGSATEIERIEIYWPTSGIRQVFDGPAPDRSYRIVEGVDEIEAI
jgi:hypothetical protein